MSLVLAHASAADAARIAEIHMAAFGRNGMLLAQFPTPSVRRGLQEAIEAKALADILDPRITVLVVQEVEIEQQSPKNNGRIIGFAKWIHPVATGENYAETPWVWPEGTTWDVLDAWTRTVEEAEKNVLGKSPCYRLTFMSTDPLHQKRGAATMMVQWGLEHCKREGVPAYLESTMEAAPLYSKNGFTVAATMSLSMKGEGDNTDKVYQEVACIFRPWLKIEI
ncbi:putative GNAT family acetyltransferase [Melanomma pulvis-pyrius CBS 109.77]|uniref:Putative GNAT family acetyltransferase n=1 Tax=Melanomma pulvis-pyrius CBS 109.77 TaxID=1314802 RepID=A0A6A6WTU7_9PLEO|nr:putative GNAT family acetyltransferase [Melanomma pulvis-pyrius CBS 109.77]